MSHFTVVAVVNPNTTDLEKLMAPYCEQDEAFFTPHNTKKDFLEDYEKHKNRADFLAECPSGTIKDFLIWWKEKTPVIKDTHAHLMAVKNHEGHAVFDKDGNLLEVIGYWNDRAKWDWYTANGRWGQNYGFIFKDKDFDPSNGVTVGDLDIDAMVAKEEEDARANYKDVIKFIGHIPHLDVTWKDVCKVGENWDDPVRKELEERYRNQADIIAFDEYKEKNKLFFVSVEEYCCTEEEYVNKTSLPYYSLVDETGWYEHGTMGWFGVSYDEMDSTDWKKMQIEFFKRNIAENPNAGVVMLDCHI